MTCRAFISFFCSWLVCGSVAWSATDAALPELTENDAQYMLQRYFIAKARALTAKAHERWTPEQFKEQQETIRQSLVKTFMLPPPAGKAQGISLGMTEVDGVAVERRVVRTRPGVYSCSCVLIYLQFN